MTIAKRVINTPKVKVTLYRNLEGQRPGLNIVRKGDFEDNTETLIVEIHGWGRAAELVIE